MEFDGYMYLTRRTAIYPADTVVGALTYTTLGLAGEAGEVAQVIKRVMRDEVDNIITEEKYEQLKAELGDCLWYLARCCDEAKLSFDEIAEANIEKLISRQARGALHGSGDKR